jgi:glycerol uptake facilitator-like aquaporin
MASDLVEPQLLITEAIGTFFIVFIISFSFLNMDLGIFSWMEVAFAAFIVVFITIYMGYKVSGANYNPSLTLSLVISKKLDPVIGGAYILSQLIGSLVAGLFLIWLATDDQLIAAVDKSELGMPTLVSGYSLLQAFVLEFFFTSLIVILYFLLVKDGSSTLVLSTILGLFVALSIITIGPLTGASLNISRLFGPSVISGVFTNQWLYWLSSLLSALLVGWFFRHAQKDTNDLDKIDIQS